MVGARNTALKHYSRHLESVLLLQSSSFVQFLHSHLFHTHNFTTYIHDITQNTLSLNTQASIAANELNREQGIDTVLIIHLQNLGVNANASQFVQAV